MPNPASFVVVHNVFTFYSEENVIIDPLVKWAYAVVSEDFRGCICDMAIDTR